MTPPLTVACVWVRGEYPYSVDYVVRLRSMVARWLARPFAFVCLTDRPDEVTQALGADVAIPVVKLAGFAPWTKLELFNPSRAWPGRVLYLDLDSIVVAPLDAIVDVPASFAITDDPASAHKKARKVDSFGRAIVRRFNSSVMVWDGWRSTELFADWRPHVSQRLSGDQDWIGERAPGAVALPRAWFPRLSELVAGGGLQLPGPDAKVVLAKRPKNHEAVEVYPWVAEAWR